MHRNAIIAALSAILLAGCYHVTVVTATPPGNKVVDKPWQMSFVRGLIPPPAVDAKGECPQGVATVETEISFLNGLVGGLSWGLVTPLHVRVTCK